MALYQIVHCVHPLVCVLIYFSYQWLVFFVYMLLSFLWMWCLKLKLPLFLWWKFIRDRCLISSTWHLWYPKWLAAVLTVYLSLSLQSAWSGEFWLLCFVTCMFVCLFFAVWSCHCLYYSGLTYFMMLLYYTILGFGFVTFDSSLPVEKTANIHYHQINGKTV